MLPGSLSGKERKRSRFTEEQILFALKQVAAGRPVADVCRQMGISEAASYVWKKRYGNLGLLEIRELRQLRSLPSFEWRISLGSSPGGRLDVKKRFSEEQIIGFLKEADQGLPVKELCRKRGFRERAAEEAAGRVAARERSAPGGADVPPLSVAGGSRVGWHCKWPRSQLLRVLRGCQPAQ